MKKLVLQVIVPEELWAAAICFTHTKHLTLLFASNYVRMESLNDTKKVTFPFPGRGGQHQEAREGSKATLKKYNLVNEHL